MILQNLETLPKYILRQKKRDANMEWKKMIRKGAGGRKVANGKWIAASGETFAVRIANHASFRGLETLRETF